MRRIRYFWLEIHREPGLCCCVNRVLRQTDDNFSNELSSIEVAADVKFSGHDTPVEPDLLYFKNESDIEKLVQMRTGGNKNKIESKTYKFQCNRTSGIKEKEALQLDAVLNQLKCGVSAFISKETKRENRTELEYTIEF